MFVFQKIKFYKVMMLAVALILIPGWVLGSPNKIKSWRSAGILRDFAGRPNEKTFRVSQPEIVKLDTTGADLIFRITPRNVSGCTQVFRIGWKFEKNVNFVRETESFSVQMYNRPAGDTGVGFKKCYQRAKQMAYDGGLLSLAFRPSSATHFHYKPAYSKYHQGKAQYLFTKTTDVYRVLPVPPGTHVNYARDGFFVQDSPYRKSPGYVDAEYGSLSFNISKGGVFSYTVTYLYKAGASSPGDRLGRQWNETESGWKGVWRRRGNSNIFDARWSSGRGTVTAVLTINISGNRVTVKRRQSSDGNNCDYTGTIGKDGVSVSGTYGCARYPGPFTWRAVIQR